MFVLTKILPVFFYPVGLSCLLGLGGLLALLLNRARTALLFLCLSVAILWAASSPALSVLLVRSLEGRYQPGTDYPPASAIIALGGGEEPPVPPRIYPELSMYGDRLMHAARLYHQGKAPYVITTGGPDPFGVFPRPLSHVAADILAASFSVPATAILTEERSRNTYEHAPEVRKVLSERGLSARVILVTSALHMPRSVAVFEEQGFTVYPAPTDFTAGAGGKSGLMTFLPNAGTLMLTTRAIHEYYGFFIYRVLGRI